MSTEKDPFATIDSEELTTVAGGAARIASGASSSSDDQLMMMMQQIGDSIKDLAANNNGGGGDQMMQMMMMMMMMPATRPIPASRRTSRSAPVAAAAVAAVARAGSPARSPLAGHLSKHGAERRRFYFRRICDRSDCLLEHARMRDRCVDISTRSPRHVRCNYVTACTTSTLSTRTSSSLQPIACCVAASRRLAPPRSCAAT
jgi:hypothetical protein